MYDSFRPIITCRRYVPEVILLLTAWYFLWTKQIDEKIEIHSDFPLTIFQLVFSSMDTRFIETMIFLNFKWNPCYIIRFYVSRLTLWFKSSVKSSAFLKKFNILLGKTITNVSYTDVYNFFSFLNHTGKREGLFHNCLLPDGETRCAESLNTWVIRVLATGDCEPATD